MHGSGSGAGIRDSLAPWLSAFFTDRRICPLHLLLAGPTPARSTFVADDSGGLRADLAGLAISEPPAPRITASVQQPTASSHQKAGKNDMNGWVKPMPRDADRRIKGASRVRSTRSGSAEAGASGARGIVREPVQTHRCPY
jgi:hypothetical protein